jgi:hypothetical protein
LIYKGIKVVPMRRIVISQPFFFPWVGLFEQIRLADVYVHYDDVQFSKGSFVNRVQFKTPAGSRWLTVALRDLRFGQPIREVTPDDTQNWRSRHLEQLGQAYAAAPFCDEMLTLVRKVYNQPMRTISDISRASIAAVCRYFDLADPDRFLFASDLGVPGSNTQRVLDIVRRLNGDVYVTAHGGKNYLDHAAFEQHGIRVEYMDYRRTPYPQLHGAFDPHVSILDLIANVGRRGTEYIHSQTVPWRQFLQGSLVASERDKHGLENVATSATGEPAR